MSDIENKEEVTPEPKQRKKLTTKMVLSMDIDGNKLILGTDEPVIALFRTKDQVKSIFEAALATTGDSLAAKEMRHIFYLLLSSNPKVHVVKDTKKFVGDILPKKGKIVTIGSSNGINLVSLFLTNQNETVDKWREEGSPLDTKEFLKDFDPKDELAVKIKKSVLMSINRESPVAVPMTDAEDNFLDEEIPEGVTIH